MATGYQPINYTSPVTPALIQQLLGQQTTGNTTGSTSGTTQGNTSGTTTGSSSTTSSAELGPLLQAFAQASQGMSPEMLSSVISSIFAEGAQQVPGIVGAYANATGSRANNNSTVKLMIDELNKNMTTQAVQSLLNFNQSSQQTATNAASQIANNTRSQQQQQSQQQTGNTQQIQTGNSQQQQTQQSSVNPKAAGGMAGGLGVLSALSQTGILKRLGLGGAGAAAGDAAAGGSPGAISGGGSLVPNGGGSPFTLTNGGGESAGMFSTPSASQGFLQGPVSTNPYGVSSGIGGGSFAGGGGGGGAVAGGAPDPTAFWPSGGITGYGGYVNPGGGLGTGMDFSFGGLPSNFNVFGTAGTDSLGSNLNFGSNPYDYAPSSGGITGIMDPGGGWGGAFTQGIGNIAGGVGDFFGGLLGGAGDWLGSFFADGGQVQTGGSASRVRNQNYMGARPQQQRSEAMNYEGYAPTLGVGSSVPAGGSPTLVAAPVAAAAAPGTTAQSSSGADVAAQARAQYAQQIAFAEALAAGIRGQGGGSGGVGEGAAPGQSESGNGQAGIGPSGIAAAPNGTTQGIGTAAGLIGMPAPGLSTMLAFIAAMAAAVNAANQGMGGAGISAPSPEGSVTVGALGSVDAEGNPVGGGGDSGGVGVGASGGPGSGGDGGPGDSGVGGDSAGDGSSGSAGTSAGGDGWADGGLVLGAGTGISDSIKVKPRTPGGKQISYSDGEYVIPQDVVKTLGVDHFDRLVAAFHTPSTLQ